MKQYYAVLLILLCIDIRVAAAPDFLALPPNFQINSDGTLLDHLGRQLSPRYLSKNRVWDEEQETIFLEGLRGETISFQVIYHNTTDSTVVLFPGITDMRSNEGRISGDHILIYREISLQEVIPDEGLGHLTQDEKEEILILPLNPEGSLSKLVTPSRSLQRFWIEIKIPETTVPGKYTGKFFLSSPSGLYKSLNISIEVYPLNFSQKSEFHVSGLFLMPPFWKWYPYLPSLLGSPESYADLYKIIILLRENNFDVIIPGISPYLDTGDSASFQWKEYDRFIKPFLVHKKPQQQIFPLSIPVRNFLDILDEESFLALLNDYIDHWKMLSKHPPKQILYLLPEDFKTGVLERILAKASFPDYVLPAVNLTTAKKYSEVIAIMQNSGVKLIILSPDKASLKALQKKLFKGMAWMKTDRSNFPQLQSSLFYRDAGCIAFSLGFEGLFLSRINAWGLTSPFIPRENNMEKPLFYPSPGGEPVLSLRLKRLRNAYQDYCLLSSLAEVSDSSLVRTYLEQIFNTEDLSFNIPEIPFNDDPEILNETFHNIRLDLVRFKYPEYIRQIRRKAY